VGFIPTVAAGLGASSGARPHFNKNEPQESQFSRLKNKHINGSPKKADQNYLSSCENINFPAFD